MDLFWRCVDRTRTSNSIGFSVHLTTENTCANMKGCHLLWICKLSVPTLCTSWAMGSSWIVFDMQRCVLFRYSVCVLGGGYPIFHEGFLCLAHPLMQSKTLGCALYFSSGLSFKGPQTCRHRGFRVWSLSWGQASLFIPGRRFGTQSGAFALL